ncbi:hypothetical protein ACFRAQ_34755 [Nocardia sp. NPDC056611]|uniref:hypothetical protein n=1 Tax=Nocardia sp. NPDC056611 TaxID=3345877 RepID=UPI00366DB179
MRVVVSERTWVNALDSTATSFHDEHPEVPLPQQVRDGSVVRYDYGELDGVPLFALLDRLNVMAEAFSGGGVDAETEADGDAIYEDWRRLRDASEPREAGYYTDRDGRGWYRDGQRWHFVRRITGSGSGVAAGEGSGGRPWIDIGRAGPFEYVSSDWPGEGWREVV